MVDEKIKNSLVCPNCHNALFSGDTVLICKGCRRTYPVIENIPVLINEDKGIFKVDDFRKGRPTTIELRTGDQHFLRRMWKRIVPEMTLNIGSRKNFKKLKDEVLRFNAKPAVLILGGSILGLGADQLIEDGRITAVETDVSFGPRAQIICDAHTIPFSDGSFDAVVVQAVLEHVLDPDKCVAEIHRVLKPGGLVYSEIPFMQQVHMERYDFTRFTDMGQRRLFRKFEEIERGIIGGPASALAWSLRYFLISFSDSRIVKKILSTFAIFAFFWIKYFDYFLVNKRSSYCGASGFYFMGRKGDKTLSDREIISLYRG